MESPPFFHIAVGSQNPAKIEAVRLGFKTLFPRSQVDITPVDVDSEVGVQPFGMETTIQGAITRAKKAFISKFGEIKEKFSIGVGIEAGMIPVPFTKTGYLDFQFCAVYQNSGEVSIGLGPAFEYPQKIVDMLLKDPDHHEIGSVIAKLSGIPDAKEKKGAIGLLSDDALHRSHILQYSVIMAVLPLKKPDLYSE